MASYSVLFRDLAYLLVALFPWATTLRLLALPQFILSIRPLNWGPCFVGRHFIRIVIIVYRWCGLHRERIKRTPNQLRPGTSGSFPKLGVLGIPRNKDCSIFGSILGSPNLGNYQTLQGVSEFESLRSSLADIWASISPWTKIPNRIQQRQASKMNPTCFQS